MQVNAKHFATHKSRIQVKQVLVESFVSGC